MNLATIPRRQWYVWIPVVIIVAALVLDDIQRSGGRNAAGSHAGHSDTHYLLEHSESLTRLEIIRDGDRFLFERRDGTWNSLTPANSHDHSDEHKHGHGHEQKDGQISHSHDDVGESIDQSIQAFLRTRVKRRFDHEGLVKLEYGLGSPALTVNVYSGPVGAPVQVLNFGDAAPDPFSRYVSTGENDSVMTVADYQYKNLTALIDTVSGHTH